MNKIGIPYSLLRSRIKKWAWKNGEIDVIGSGEEKMVYVVNTGQVVPYEFFLRQEGLLADHEVLVEGGKKVVICETTL